MLSFAERCPIWRTLWPVQRDSARSERTPRERHILEKRGMARTSCRKLHQYCTYILCCHTNCHCRDDDILQYWQSSLLILSINEGRVSNPRQIGWYKVPICFKCRHYSSLRKQNSLMRSWCFNILQYRQSLLTLSIVWTALATFRTERLYHDQID